MVIGKSAQTMNNDEISYSSEDDELFESKSPESAPTKTSAKGVEAERRWVIWSKVFVVVVLLASAGVVGYLTFSFMDHEQLNDFEAMFRYDARDVLDATRTSAMSLRNNIRASSLMFTSYAKSQQAIFPNFSLPDFEALASLGLNSSGTVALVYSPLVSDSDREGFEAYATENAGWIAESFSYHGLEVPLQPVTISEVIYRKSPTNHLKQEPPGPYSPIWQLSPPPLDYSMILLNLYNDPTFKRLVDFIVQTKESTISEVLDVASLLGLPALVDDDPLSLLIQPVFKSFLEKNQTVVGSIMMATPWRIFFTDAFLHDDASILDVVMRESCGTSFTYRIQGGRAPVFRGMGDLHETKYDYLMEYSDFMVYEGDFEGTVLEDHCQYTVQVYPTSQMEDALTSNQPIVYTVIVLGIFFFASTVFFLYDIFVMKRQRVVQETALRAMSLVTSLFPGNVADQLAQDKAEEDRKKKETAALAKKRKHAIRNGFLDADDETNDQYGNAEEVDDDIVIDSKPIADLFPSATVLFADISGFTAWSSIREPSQVFILLENIYRNFDK